MSAGGLRILCGFRTPFHNNHGEAEPRRKNLPKFTNRAA